MWNFSKSLLLSLRRPVFAYLMTLSLTTQVFFAGGFYFLEQEANGKILTFFDALYFTVTVMTGVGLGDVYPVTVAGRALAMAMMLAGTAIFVCFTASLGASILEIASLDVRDSHPE